MGETALLAHRRRSPPNPRMAEQMPLHATQTYETTPQDSTLREEMQALEPAHDGAKTRELKFKPLGWLGWTTMNNGLWTSGRRSTARQSACTSPSLLPNLARAQPHKHHPLAPFVSPRGSFEVTVTSVSLPSFVSHRGLFNTNHRLSQTNVRRLRRALRWASEARWDAQGKMLKCSSAIIVMNNIIITLV